MGFNNDNANWYMCTQPPTKKTLTLTLTLTLLNSTPTTNWLVWRSGNGVRHINEVTLRRARLLLGLVTIFSGSTIPVFIQATKAHSAWPSLRG